MSINTVWPLLAENLKDAHTLAIIGCGSLIRGDDAAGMVIAERLTEPGENVRVYSGSTAPENFTGEIKKFKPDVLLVIDAADMALPPGEAAIIPPEKIDGVSFSTHTLPLKIMLEYLRKEIGCRPVLLGIQGASYEFGADLTPAVRITVEQVVQALSGVSCSLRRTP